MGAAPSPAPPHPQHADDVAGLIQLHVALCRQDALHRLQDAGCHGDIAADKHVAPLEAQHAVHLSSQLRPQDILHVGLRGGGVRGRPRRGTRQGRAGRVLGAGKIPGAPGGALVRWGAVSRDGDK